VAVELSDGGILHYGRTCAAATAARLATRSRTWPRVSRYCAWLHRKSGGESRTWAGRFMIGTEV
jgi:hypothetical protein